MRLAPFFCCAFLWIAAPGLHCQQSQSAVPTVLAITDQSFLYQEDALPRRKPQLTPADIDFDLTYLIAALDRAYSGRDHLPEGEYAKLTTRLNDLRAVFAQPVAGHAGNLLCLKITEILSQVPDSHLYTYSAYNQQFRPKHPDVGPNVFKGTGVYSREETVAGKKVTILSLGTFMPEKEDASWMGFEDKIAGICRKSDALVLDLRGNGGGMSDNIRWLASYLYGTSPKMADEIILTRESGAVEALGHNEAWFEILEARSEGRPEQKYLLEEKRQYLEAFKAEEGKPPAWSKSVRSGSEATFNSQKGFGKPVCILIDGGTASSAEGGYARFLSHPKVRTFGTNTGGYIHYGDTKPLVLPRSGIVVSIPTSYRSFSDGRFLEKIGYAPDVRVPDGGDALQVALSDLAQQWMTP